MFEEKKYITSEFIFYKLKTLRKKIEEHINNKSIHNEVKIEYNANFEDKRKGL